MSQGSMQSNIEKIGLVRLIAAFKLLKALGLIVLAYGILQLLNPVFAAWLADLAAQSPYPLEQRLIDRLLDFAAGADPNHIHRLGLAAFLYAGLFVTEGLGLWWDRPWAEWLTVIVTASFIPVEIWHFLVTPRSLTLLVTAANAAILSYFIVRLQTRHKIKAHPVAGTGLRPD
jgi:uncharacterized membrane protein (DUF2068 family)